MGTRETHSDIYLIRNSTISQDIHPICGLGLLLCTHLNFVATVVYSYSDFAFNIAYSSPRWVEDEGCSRVPEPNPDREWQVSMSINT